MSVMPLQAPQDPLWGSKQMTLRRQPWSQPPQRCLWPRSSQQMQQTSTQPVTQLQQ